MDFCRVFDSVGRVKLHEAGFDNSFKTYKSNRDGYEIHYKIKYDNMLNESFTFNKGVTQGYGLSVTLFFIALHYIIKDEDQSGKV